MRLTHAQFIEKMARYTAAGTWENFRKRHANDPQIPSLGEETHRMVCNLAKVVDVLNHDAAAMRLIQASLKAPLNEDDVKELEWQKHLAAKARRAADRQDGIITKLRATQDAFTTKTLPGVDVPSSVVIQKP